MTSDEFRAIVRELKRAYQWDGWQRCDSGTGPMVAMCGHHAFFTGQLPRVGDVIRSGPGTVVAVTAVVWGGMRWTVTLEARP